MIEFENRPNNCSICKKYGYVRFLKQESTWLCRRCLNFVLGRWE